MDRDAPERGVDAAVVELDEADVFVKDQSASAFFEVSRQTWPLFQRSVYGA
jgi:hypothetical protein